MDEQFELLNKLSESTFKINLETYVNDHIAYLKEFSTLCHKDQLADKFSILLTQVEAFRSNILYKQFNYFIRNPPPRRILSIIKNKTIYRFCIQLKPVLYRHKTILTFKNIYQQLKHRYINMVINDVLAIADIKFGIKYDKIYNNIHYQDRAFVHKLNIKKLYKFRKFTKYQKLNKLLL
jgi:hypothetical protein